MSPEPDDDTSPGQSDHRLAVYGTLAPGRSNHGQARRSVGRWINGWVRGVLHRGGWGATYGYPGIVVNEDGPRVVVQVFESIDLVAHSSRLDEFEGSAYRRVGVEVTTTPAGFGHGSTCWLARDQRVGTRR